ncbi:MAG: hypothetical protein Q7T80_16280 [Methanoregula sp.]|nr:hypothetical protein [Methanoregula sp.]
MKKLFVRLLTTFLIIIVVVSCGCTDSEQAVPSAAAPEVTPVPSPHITENHPRETPPSTIAVTTVLQPATTVQVTTTKSPVKIFNGEYRWVEYRMNHSTSYNPGRRVYVENVVKNERSSELYNGIPAIHEKNTVTSDTINWTGNFEKIITKNGFHSTQHLYFEKSTKRFLGGTYVASGIGEDKPEEILPMDETYCGNCFRSWLVITPFDDMNISLSSGGVESVTVPAGTYPKARKYSGNLLEKSPITFWISEGIPVPIQYQIQNSPGADGNDPLETFELMGWG